MWFGSPQPLPGRVVGALGVVAAGSTGVGAGVAAGGGAGGGGAEGCGGDGVGVAAGGGAGGGGAGDGGCGCGDGCFGPLGAGGPAVAGAATSRELVCTLAGAGVGRAEARARAGAAACIRVRGFAWGAAVFAGGSVVTSRFSASPVQSNAGASGENGLGEDGSNAARHR